MLEPGLGLLRERKLDDNGRRLKDWVMKGKEESQMSELKNLDIYLDIFFPNKKLDARDI